MITQRRLRHLLLLVEYGHFGRAAAALNISQPALTKSIQALEAELGFYAQVLGFGLADAIEPIEVVGLSR